MGVKRPVALGLASSVLACCVTVLLASTAAQAALTIPDAMCYGRAAAGGVVSARLGATELGSYTVGSNPAAPTFYGLSIPVAQLTQTGEVLSPPVPTEGGMVQLFLDDRFVAEVEVRSGTVTRRDLVAVQTLCSGGANDGDACAGDGDCPGGVCVTARALCDGGNDDGQACQCIGGSCSLATACTETPSMGTCAGGALEGTCCDTAQNCDGGTCMGSQKLCAAGENKGEPCLRNSHCPGSQCVSPTEACVGGDRDGFSCIDAADCPGGDCGAPVSTPTATATATATRTGMVVASPTPTATPIVAGCAGDCDGSDMVAINELIKMVNIALGLAPVSECTAGDGDGSGDIAINELIAGVNRALNGCG